MTGEDNPRVLVPPPLIFASLLALGLLIKADLTTSISIRIAAAASIAAGLALIVAALGGFRRAQTRPEPWQPSTALVAKGVYGFTRNPMYLGMALVCFGAALLFTSAAAAILTIVASVVIDRTVIAREEAYLLRRFGSDYEAYRGRVRKWL